MEKKERKESKTKERELIDLAMKRLKLAVEAENHNRDAAISDLNFLNGEQWEMDERDRRKRRKRPMLTINMLPDKVDKVVGDMRQNRAKVKIRPADSQANSEIAQIREGMIMAVEYKSNASTIYDYAGSRMVECGEGAWEVKTRYCEDNPFVQEIYLEIIKNSFNVFLDPAAKDHCKADAKWGFITTKLTRDEFEEMFPKGKYPSDSLNLGNGLSKELWYTTDTLTIARYFLMKPTTKTMCLMEDGDVLEKKDAEKLVKEWEEEQRKKMDKMAEMLQQAVSAMPPMGGGSPVGPPAPGMVPPPPAPAAAPGVQPPPSSPGIVPNKPPMGGMGMGGPPSLPTNQTPQPPPNMGQPPMAPPTPMPLPEGGPKILKEKETEIQQVWHYTITAAEILDGPTRIPGKYIPIVKPTGKERNIEGKDYVRGLIRDAKDPQRLVNYWNTSAAETVALAPKAPWVGTAKQFEGYETDYANANIDNYPFLKYNPDQAAPGPPVRTRPGEPPVALFTQIQIAEKNLNTVVGTMPDLRDVAPDASAKSITTRMKPAELSTFPFVDNLAQAQLHGYKIINEMIPEVYDTERDVPIRKVDGTETYVPINMKAEDALKLIKNNPERYRGMNAAKLKNAIIKNGGKSKFNDIGMGRYELIMDIGPSYATQRQESADKFTMLAQTNPKLWQIAGDLIVKSLDVQGADEMAARIRKTLPPGLVRPKPGEDPEPPMPPSPQAQLMQQKIQTEAVKQKKEMMKWQVELVKQKTELIKQYKELKSDDREMKQKILQIMSELHAPEHPADQYMQPPGMGGGGMEGTGDDQQGGM